MKRSLPLVTIRKRSNLRQSDIFSTVSADAEDCRKWDHSRMAMQTYSGSKAPLKLSRLACLAALLAALAVVAADEESAAVFGHVAGLKRFKLIWPCIPRPEWQEVELPCWGSELRAYQLHSAPP